MCALARTVRSALLVAAALVVAPAAANTITENFIIPDASTGPRVFLLPPNCLAGPSCDLTVPVVVFSTTVPTFDPANGTLTEVDISLTGTAGWTNETTLTSTLRCCTAFGTLFSEVFVPTPLTQGLTQIFLHNSNPFIGSIVPISFNMGGMSTDPSVLADLSLGSPRSPFGNTFGLELDLIDNLPSVSNSSRLEFNGLAVAGGGPLNGTVTFDFTPNAAVPEPSTWAMMLLGFAGLGFAFRQSRRRVSLGGR